MLSMAGPLPPPSFAPQRQPAVASPPAHSSPARRPGVARAARTSHSIARGLSTRHIWVELIWKPGIWHLRHTHKRLPPALSLSLSLTSCSGPSIQHQYQHLNL